MLFNNYMKHPDISSDIIHHKGNSQLNKGYIVTGMFPVIFAHHQGAVIFWYQVKAFLLIQAFYSWKFRAAINFVWFIVSFVLWLNIFPIVRCIYKLTST